MLADSMLGCWILFLRIIVPTPLAIFSSLSESNTAQSSPSFCSNRAIFLQTSSYLSSISLFSISRRTRHRKALSLFCLLRILDRSSTGASLTLRGSPSLKEGMDFRLSCRPERCVGGLSERREGSGTRLSFDIDSSFLVVSEGKCPIACGE